MLSIDDGWAKYTAMRGFGGDCWENSKHERVCKDDNTCKFGRNFCTFINNASFMYGHFLSTIVADHSASAILFPSTFAVPLYFQTLP